MLFWRVALLRTHRINPNLRLTRSFNRVYLLAGVRLAGFSAPMITPLLGAKSWQLHDLVMGLCVNRYACGRAV